MTEDRLIFAVVVAGLLVAFLLILAGTRLRRRLGLAGGKTISLDKVTLTSRRLGLIGRPDRLIKSGGTVIIEEWKSSRTLQPWHKAQMGVYFLLVEDQMGITPRHGFLVTGDGKRHRIENDDRLRAWVVGMAEQIRAARATAGQPMTVDPAPWQCRPCGMRDHCSQARHTDR